MYVVAAVGMVVYLVLYVLSTKKTVKIGNSKGLKGVFDTMGIYLYETVFRWKKSSLINVTVEKNLRRLHPGRNREELCQRYYVDKLSKSLLIGFAGIVLSLLLCVKSGQNQILNANGELVRGEYLEESQEVSLSLQNEEFAVTVEPRRLTVTEAETIYKEFLEELEDGIVGANLSLEEISQDMVLPEELEGYPFYVEWESECPDLLKNTGEIKEIQEMHTFRLTATVSYLDMEWIKDYTVTVVPRSLTDEELWYREISELLEVSARDSAEEEVWTLPQRYGEEVLYWEQVSEDNSILLWMGSLLVAIAIFFVKDSDLQKEVEERKECLKHKYPEILQKMVLYMGAGMTIRGSFRKLADDYLVTRENNGREEAAMEEILYTCRELQAGIPEGRAYENLGKRTGVQDYIRFCTLLQQNLKKGSSTLLTRLREEADKAAFEKFQSSRRKCEEAVTKLLVPMVMMLLVVMVMIMIPAFTSTTL